MTYKIGKLTDYYFQWNWLEGSSYLNVLKEYVKDTEYVYDSDNCGDETMYYAVGKDGDFVFYKVHHEWYWSGNSREDMYLENEFDYTLIDEKEARKQVKDWFVV